MPLAENQRVLTLGTLDAANAENGYGTLTDPTLSNVATAVAATFYATRATPAETIKISMPTHSPTVPKLPKRYLPMLLR